MTPLSPGADLRQKASSATLPERPPLPSLLLPFAIARQNLAFRGPQRPEGLQGPTSQGPRRPLHEWPPVKSAPVSHVSRTTQLDQSVEVGRNVDIKVLHRHSLIFVELSLGCRFHYQPSSGRCSVNIGILQRRHHCHVPHRWVLPACRGISV